MSDDRLDPNALQIVKDQAKSVIFKENHDVIPVSTKYPAYEEISGGGEEEEEEEEEQEQALGSGVEQPTVGVVIDSGASATTDSSSYSQADIVSLHHLLSCLVLLYKYVLFQLGERERESVCSGKFIVLAT